MTNACKKLLEFINLKQAERSQRKPAMIANRSFSQARNIKSFNNSLRRKVLLLALLMSIASTGYAGSWFGVRTGYPQNITAHYGIEDILFTGINLRASANVSQRQAFMDYYNGDKSPSSFGIGLDALLKMLDVKPINLYLGTGATVNFLDAKTITDLHLLAGLEFRPNIPLLNQLGIFTEASGAYGLVNINEKSFQQLSWTIGVNWHLP